MVRISSNSYQKDSPSNDTGWSSYEDGSKFPHYAHEEEHGGADKSRRTRRVPSQSDDTGVLREGGEWWDSHETGQGSADCIGEHTALDPLDKRLTRDRESRNVGRRSDVSNTLTFMSVRDPIQLRSCRLTSAIITVHAAIIGSTS